MKSKKKMLLALGAMSAAAIGAGATSTFAWYTSSAKANVTNGAAVTGSVVSTASADASMGTFTIKAKLDVTGANGVILTDDAGITKLLVNGENVPVAIGSSKAIGIINITGFDIVYTPEAGTSVAQSQLPSVWDTAINEKVSVTVTLTDNSDVVDATNKPVTAGGGLKFTLDADPSDDGAVANGGWAGAAANGVKTILKAALKSDSATVAFTSATAGTAMLASPVPVYVGIKGIDSTDQSGWSYGVSAATAVNAA